jgi:hypothetical protein
MPLGEKCAVVCGSLRQDVQVKAPRSDHRPAAAPEN